MRVQGGARIIIAARQSPPTGNPRRQAHPNPTKQNVSFALFIAVRHPAVRRPPKKAAVFVSKTSTRLALTPVYLPYINRIFGVNCYFGAKTLRFTAIRKCLSGMPFKARKCR